jgi:hypothetical protein
MNLEESKMQDLIERLTEAGNLTTQLLERL